MRRYPEKMFWKNTQPKSGCPENKLKMSTLPPSDEALSPPVATARDESLMNKGPQAAHSQLHQPFRPP